MTRPLCFVLMPFGTKSDPTGNSIDFDSLYRGLIAPAIELAQMTPLRADEELAGGIIHKPMFERLLLCEYAVADLTTANANVFYELGARHAMRPWSTVLIFAEGARLPFDLAPERALPYRLDDSGRPLEVEAARSALASRLRAARDAQTDSPIYQLVDGLPPPQIERLKSELFREQMRYSLEIKRRLEEAREQGIEAVRQVGQELEPICDVEAGLVIDLFLSYRSVQAWADMIALVNEMSSPLAATVLVQEQLALALNRAGRRRDAERVVTQLLERRGPSSETYGILGRIYKDLWLDALRRGDAFEARAHLNRAIETYLQGFESDWRDAYPGINVLTLMEVRQPPDPRQKDILPVVRYAVGRRLASKKAEYWDFAIRLELAVLARDEETALEALGDVLANARERWEVTTTVSNLQIIRDSREARGEDLPWARAAEERLLQKSRDWDRH